MYVIGGNILVWLVSMMDTTQSLLNLLVFTPMSFCRGEVWRIVTFAFVPSTTSILWFALSMYFFYFIGSSLEQAWGMGKFTIYYISGLLLSAVYALIYYWITGMSIPVTGYYVNLSLFFAYATMWPDQMFFMLFIPIKAKWLAWLDAGLFALEIVQTFVQLRGVAFVMGLGLALVPVVAVANYLIFCGQWLFDFFRPANVRAQAQQKARTIQFKQAVKKTQTQQQGQAYRRKCAVCGRTDRDYPDLEFRYCSRCAGYHCFCIDHINDHIHFTE